MHNFFQPLARVAKEQVSADHPGTFPDHHIHQDSFYIIRTHFRDYPDTFQIVRNLSKSSTLFLDYPDTFSRLNRHFKDHPETFQIIQTLCILYGFLKLEFFGRKFQRVGNQARLSLRFTALVLRISSTFYYRTGIFVR